VGLQLPGSGFDPVCNACVGRDALARDPVVTRADNPADAEHRPYPATDIFRSAYRAKLSITDLDLKSKRVFIRVDFNVPLDEEGKITNDARIRASLPTIQYALSKGARVLLASHLGRPKGKPNAKMSLRPVATALGGLREKVKWLRIV
jgi:hypothetical protein